jgi:predicted nucleic-acid-binding protein
VIKVYICEGNKEHRDKLKEIVSNIILKEEGIVVDYQYISRGIQEYTKTFKTHGFKLIVFSVVIESAIFILHYKYDRPKYCSYDKNK